MVNFDSYLEPPDYGEGEKDMNRTLYCQDEDCSEFEVEVDKDVTVQWWGGSGGTASGTATYTCPKCGKDSEHEFDLDAEDFGYDPDAEYERMRDEDW